MRYVRRKDEELRGEVEPLGMEVQWEDCMTLD